MKPSLRELARALVVVADVLDVDRADYCFDGRFRFDLDGDWSLVLSADDAGRFRVSACLRSRVRCTLWTRADDPDRLRALVEAAKHEAAALVA